MDYNHHPETLAEFLLMSRTDLGLSQVQVSEHVKIPLKYLSALENSAYENLPADVYVMGFLAKLSKLYKADYNSLTQQYKFERDLHVKHVTDSVRRKKLNIFPSFTITPKFLSLFLGSLVIMSTLGWLFWQIIGINTKPSLEIFEPANGAVVMESVVKLKGRTDPGSVVRLNKETIFVDKEGFFDATLSVSAGQNDLLVEASNKFDKTTAQNLSVVADLPERDAVNAPDDKNKNFNIEISVEKDLPISITLDNKVIPTEVFKAKTSKSFEVKEKIVILTPDAGNTLIKVNDKSIGALGKKGEVLTVPFTSKEVDAIMNSTKPNN